MSGANKSDCLYLGETLEHNRCQCALFSVCQPQPDGTDVQDCESCNEYAPQKVSFQPAQEWIDPLIITDRTGTDKTTVLRNMLGGGAAFLVCGGPSLKDLPIDKLAERGIFSLGINNVAAHAPTTAFVCSDPPVKFHNGIFEDPKIMKFLPIPKLQMGRGQMRMRDEHGKLVASGRSTCLCPNVWGFERRSWLMPDDTWFTDEAAAWGNHDEGTKKTGQPKTVNTMLLGLRILQYLGARKIFLLGVDFHMVPTRGELGNYAFNESKRSNFTVRDDATEEEKKIAFENAIKQACNSNNEQYAITSTWLRELRPVFEKRGFETYNCNPKSHLRAFDYVPFDVAFKLCKGRVPEQPWDLNGWYDK
jgi:hypothetical protein